MLSKSTAVNHLTQNKFVPNKQGELKKPKKQMSHKKNDNTLLLKEKAEPFWLVLTKSADNQGRVCTKSVKRCNYMLNFSRTVVQPGHLSSCHPVSTH